MEGFLVIDFVQRGCGPMKHVVAAALAVSMFTGCSKVQEAIRSVSAIKPNIVGKVTTSGAPTGMMKSGSTLKSSSDKTVPVFGRKLPVVSRSVEGTPVSGCTVTARNLQTGAVVATGTSASDGTYVIESDSITAGDSYRVVATCGSGESAVSFATVTSADTQDPDEKEPVSTNARSTLIAAQIVQAVLEALDAAVDAIPGASDAVRNSIKQAVLDAVDTIIAQVSAVIEEAIESGAMEEPSDTTAKNMAAVIQEADEESDPTDLEEAYTNGDDGVAGGTDGYSVPESVGNATAGAAKAVSALPFCDSDLNTTAPGTATQDKCTKAIAKLMYSLGFTVAVNTSGSYSGATCGDAAMDADFPGAEFQDLSTPPGEGEGRPQIANGCLVKSKTGKVNRNEGYDDRGGNDDSTVFVENFASPQITGTISKIAASMLAGGEYTLQNIDQIVFSHDADEEAGMNMRLLFESKSFEEGQFNRAMYYRNQAGTWTLFPECNASPCVSDLLGQNGFDSILWSSVNTTGAGGLASELTDLATEIGLGDFVSAGVMTRQYAGPVPTQSQLESFVNERSFVDNNPTGETEFHVLFQKDPRWVNPGDDLPAPASGTDPRPVACSDGDASTFCPNGCFDNDPSTTCYAVGSTLTPAAAVRVDVTLGAAITLSGESKGFRPIQSITGAAGGAYFIRPIFGPSGFLSAGQLVSATTGKLLRDDFMRPRTFFVNGEGADCPDGLSCATDAAYNVDLAWEGCNGGGPCSPTMKAIDGATASITITGIDAEVKKEYRSRWEEIHSGSNHFGHPVVVVGQGDWQDLEILTVGLNPSTGSVTVTGTASGLSDMPTGRYAVSPVWNCNNDGCEAGQFYLVNNEGIPFTSELAPDEMKWEPGKVCWPDAGSGEWTCGSHVVRFGVGVSVNWANLDSGSPDYNEEVGGTQTFDAVAASIRIPSGPAANPSHKCSFDPYFVETGSSPNGSLDCNVDDDGAISGDVSFSNMWEYQRWAQDPANSANAGAELKKNANGYRFANPVAVKNLMNTAFPGWFDGSRTIDSSTRFNALQVLSLIYLFFEGSGDDGLQVEGLAPAGLNGGFRSESPMFMPSQTAMDGGSDPVKNFNKYFGNGITRFTAN
jgi:hypothetical protein